ncbi:Fe-S cluster assembly protein SufD [Alteromonas sp. a30]|uniref:Fe-S cluster assembly protein SufD n=1 Tax=Alteromonas sp. a30 TaxID=2730917 RepID=UPI0022822B06|nr:Fe-S cluster assembly protein SufD [Alteromonas sp. a30]MCY7296403.1 Fe-S cluster assembly protein SufD [Alteromonas sp. a30]
MNAWFENALNRAVSSVEQASDALSSLKAASLAQLQQTPWPTRKTEAWKYTSLKALENCHFDSSQPAALAESQQFTRLQALDGLNIIIQDGHIQTDISALKVPTGMTINTLSQLGEVPSWVAEHFGQAKPQKHIFGLVNDVLANDVIVIDVVAEANINTPIKILHQASEGKEGQSRVLVRLGEKAKAAIVEVFMADSNSSFTNGFSEYFIAPNAKLEHYRFQLQSQKAMSAGGCHFSLQSKAKLNSTFVGFGSELSRTDIDILHKGEFADAKLNAVYLVDGNEQFDLHSTIEHEVPNCTSLENVRGIAGGKGKATFNGRIHIHRDAQKTLAELNNRNLLLTDTAQINTKPELEIYADDVRCAHGATVAQLDDASLYYLRSRGVSKEHALVMLNYGFINALVDEMSNEALSEWLRPILQQRFAEMGE